MYQLYLLQNYKHLQGIQMNYQSGLAIIGDPIIEFKTVSNF